MNKRVNPKSLRCRIATSYPLYLTSALTLAIFASILLLFGPVEIASAYQQWAILTLGVQIANEQAPAALPPSQAPINGNTTEPIAALRSPPQPPINWNATPNSILDGAINKVEESKLVVEGILKSITSSTASFYNVVLPIAHDENEATTLRSVMIFLQTVSPQQELRNACSNAEQLTNVYYGEAAANEALFKLVDAAIKKKEMLDPESQQLLENEYQSYIDSGLGIPPGPQRTRFKEITERLAELKVLFLRNLYEEDGGLWLTLENLTNVPDDFRSRLIPGEGTNEVKLYLTFKPPDLVPALEYIDDCEVRKTIFIANENKCRDNEPFFREAVILRDEAARLLAYPDWASYKTSDKIAQNTTFVVNFLEGLQQRLVPKGMMELKYLEALKDMDSKQKKTACTDDKFSLWDYKYFHRQLLQQEFDIDWQKIAEWFQLESTLQGILSTYEKLFALEFVKLEAEQFDDNFELAWHESVKAYSVWDDASEGSGFIGYLYLDLFPRVGKQGGALNANIRPGFLGRNGQRQYPVNALICNFAEPSPSQPSLLKHEELVVLFHELGHAIHDLLSRTKYSRFHGTKVAQDFVEAPSQLLENWAWTFSQLKTLSHHYAHISPEYETTWRHSHANEIVLPPRQIPDDLLERLIATRYVNKALYNLRQISIGTFDMLIHTPPTHEHITHLPIPSLYNYLWETIGLIPGPASPVPSSLSLSQSTWGDGPSTTQHLMSGYDAGYYSYLTSQVYSADVFDSAFAHDLANATTGRRYRHMVLEPGGVGDVMEHLERFLGRAVRTEAFYAGLGAGAGAGD